MRNEPFDQLEPLDRPAKPKMPLGKAVLVNLGIMLIYTSFFWISTEEAASSTLDRLFGTTLFLTLQVGLNFLTGMVLVFLPKYKHVGVALFLGGFIVAIIGIGALFAAKDYY